MSVAAIIPTYNRRDLLRRCLKALLAQTTALDEIVVVDNGSTDGTDQMMAVDFAKITCVRLPSNQGSAGGFHHGVKYAYGKGYEWLWLMDD